MGILAILNRPARAAAAANGAPTPNPGSDFWYAPVGRVGAAGRHVTPVSAIKVQAVFACVSKIAKTLAGMPVKMYEAQKGGAQIPAEDHPLEELLRYQPNMNDTAVDFWQFMLWHAILRGTAYAEIISTNRKPVASLVPLHPDRVKPELLPSGRYRFKVLEANGTTRILTHEQVFRFAGMTEGGIQGMGLCSHADEAIALALAADEYAGRVFSNQLNAGVILTHPQKLSEAAQDNLIKSFMRRLAGSSNAHRPIVLQEGLKAEKGFTQTAEEAQLLDARKWQVLEVCRALDMPPIMVGITEGALGANYEEQSLNFVRYTLQPWARRIEQAIRRDLIEVELDGKVKYKAEFNFDSLLRGNQTARGTYFSQALGSGGSPAWMAVNEVRKLDGLNPIDDPLFDKPALGTNPQQTPGTTKTETAPKKKPAPAEDAPDDTSDETEERGSPAPVSQYELNCTTLVAKEVKLLRKYAERYANDIAAWRTAVGNFYRSHVSYVMKTVGVDKDAARIYCKARESRFAAANDILSAIDNLEANGVAELVKG